MCAVELCYVLMFLQYCPNAVRQTVTGGVRQLVQQLFDKTRGEGVVCFGKVGESYEV